MKRLVLDIDTASITGLVNQIQAADVTEQSREKAIAFLQKKVIDDMICYIARAQQ
jgi:hypothetical protein